MLGIGAFKQRLPCAEEALPGREAALPLHNRHFVHGHPLRDVPGSESTTSFAGLQQAQFGMGCFWGVERKFWALPGVFTTAVGYAGGTTPHANYDEVCSGQTGHAEVVRLLWDPALTRFEALLQVFWENHDPTQGMRQGNDLGTQYRSVIFCSTQAQYDLALASRAAYQQRLHAAGHGDITTEILYPAPEFYYAEDYHQQYLAKNPDGYCGIGGTGVSCAAGLDA